MKKFRRTMLARTFWFAALGAPLIWAALAMPTIDVWITTLLRDIAESSGVFAIFLAVLVGALAAIEALDAYFIVRKFFSGRHEDDWFRVSDVALVTMALAVQSCGLIAAISVICVLVTQSLGQSFFDTKCNGVSFADYASLILDAWLKGLFLNIMESFHLDLRRHCDLAKDSLLASSIVFSVRLLSTSFAAVFILTIYQYFRSQVRRLS